MRVMEVWDIYHKKIKTCFLFLELEHRGLKGMLAGKYIISNGQTDLLWKTTQITPVYSCKLDKEKIKLRLNEINDIIKVKSY